MSINKTSKFENRQSATTPIAASVTAESLIVETALTTVNSQGFSMNGKVKTFRYIAPNLTTDTTFTFVIKDGDGGTVYTSGALAKNKTVPFYVNLTADTLIYACSNKVGDYTLSFTWTTGQILAAGVFKVDFIYE